MTDTQGLKLDGAGGSPADAMLTDEGRDQLADDDVRGLQVTAAQVEDLEKVVRGSVRRADRLASAITRQPPAEEAEIEEVTQMCLPAARSYGAAVPVRYWLALAAFALVSLVLGKVLARFADRPLPPATPSTSDRASVSAAAVPDREPMYPPGVGRS